MLPFKSSFLFDKNGYRVVVNFGCEEVVDIATGITVAIIYDIVVKDFSGKVVKEGVDMQEIERLCIEVAIENINFQSGLDLDEGYEDQDFP